MDRMRSMQETGKALEIESLVHQHYAYVRRLALSLLDDEAEADDAAQETFIAAQRALGRFRGEASPRTWLTRIAINTCRSRQRRQKGRLALQNTLQALHLVKNLPPGPEESAIQNEAERALWQALDSLDEKHRLPVILRYVHEMSIPEIAAALEMQQGTVHSRLHNAREKLHGLLLAQSPVVSLTLEGHYQDREEASS